MWKKADLHHHTWEDGAARRTGLNEYKKIIDSLHENKVNLIAITNHDKISFNSIKEYNKYIKEKNYEIKVLPGIELGFTFEKKDEKGKSFQGDLILIFNDENIELIKENYDEIFNNYKKHCSFSGVFKGIVDVLKSKDIPFISMPHFHKSSKNIDHKVFDNDYAETIISFDFLEAKFNRDNDIKSVKKAIEIIEKGYSKERKNFHLEPDAKGATGIEKVTLLGTDAHDLNNFNENIKNIPWLYNVNDFSSLKKISVFGSNRIRFGSEPAIASKIIKSIEYTSDDGKKETINFSPGLNTIIGRRGSGKSFLLNKILELNDDDKFKINFSSNLSQDNIKYLKQNMLSDKIKEMLENLYDDSNNTVEFKDVGIDHNIIKEQINNLKSTFEKIKNDFNLLYLNQLSVVKNENNLRKENKKTLFLKSFEDVLSKNNNLEHINLLNKDIDFLKNLNLNENSQWLKNEIEKIKQKILKISQDKKYNTTKHNLLLNLVKTSINKISDTQPGILSSVINLKPGEIIDGLKCFLSTSNDLAKEIKYILEKYEKYKDFNDENLIIRFNQNYNEKGLESKCIVKITDEKKDFLLNVFKKNFLIDSKIKDKFTLKTILELKPKQKKFKESNSFEIDRYYYIDNIRIDHESLGTQHEFFVKKILDNDDKDIYILDQPDDDLDAITIDLEIIQRIKEWNFKKQIIVVTHDPKIVINCDSQNIILANFNGEKELSSVDYKNVSEEELKNNIHKIIDGTKKYPYNRYKRYGGYSE